MTGESRATTERKRLDERVELLTVDEVAQVLKVPKSTLYQWSYQGEGPPVVRVGRHLRYPSDLLDAWISSGMKERNPRLQSSCGLDDRRDGTREDQH